MDARAFWHQFPVTWDPAEPGDEVKGVVEALLEVRFRDEWIPRLRVRLETGEAVLVNCGPRELLEKMVALKPAVGQKIQIRYLGLGPSRPGLNPPKRYAMRVGNSVTDDPTPLEERIAADLEDDVS